VASRMTSLTPPSSDDSLDETSLRINPRLDHP
jgi:hypothetical protein